MAILTEHRRRVTTSLPGASVEERLATLEAKIDIALALLQETRSRLWSLALGSVAGGIGGAAITLRVVGA